MNRPKDDSKTGLNKHSTPKSSQNELDSNLTESQQTTDAETLKIIEAETNIYIFNQDRIFDNAAITVLAGYEWAKDTNFDTTFSQLKFDEDRNRAIAQLRTKYSGKTLNEVIEKMIEVQTHIIQLRRRIHHRESEEMITHNIQNDKWEAKRFVAYIFFHKIVECCVEQGICPDIKINIFGTEVLHLLKSLTIEDYCKINAYLRFLARSEGNKVHLGSQESDYLESMSYLDRAFVNCGDRPSKRFASQLAVFDVDELIEKAKKNRCLDLVCEGACIEEFVSTYYSFIKRILENDSESDTVGASKPDTKQRHAVEVLKCLYKQSNTKIRHN